MPSANTSEEDAEPELSKLLLRSSDSLGRSDRATKDKPEKAHVSRRAQTPQLGFSYCEPLSKPSKPVNPRQPVNPRKPA